MRREFERVRIISQRGRRLKYVGRKAVVLSFPTEENGIDYYVVYVDPPGEAVIVDETDLEFLGELADQTEVYPGGRIRVKVVESGDENVGKILRDEED